MFKSRPEYVKVRFINGEWMGNKPPSIMTLVKQKALDLESRGVVEIIDSKEPKPLVKQVSAPEKNKMIESAPVDKSVTKKRGRKSGTTAR